MDHRGHVELDHLGVERVPVPVGERGRGPVAPGRIRVQVAADEVQLPDAALELGDRVRDGHSGGLRQLADTDEILRVQVDHALDEVVVGARPGARDGLVAEVMPHGRGARREHGEIRAALLLQPQLVLLDGFPDLVIRDGAGPGRRCTRVLQARELRIAEFLMSGRRRRVMTVAVDDHPRLLRMLLRRGRLFAPAGGRAGP